MANILLTSLLISMSPQIPHHQPTEELVGSLSFIIVLLAVMLLITISIFALTWTRQEEPV